MRYAILDRDQCIVNYTTDGNYQLPDGHRLLDADQAAVYPSRYRAILHEPEVLRAWIADQRWQREVAGIVVGTQPVSTLREEMPVWQGMLLDATVFRPGVATTYEYKPRGGASAQLTVPQLQRCYECFAWYVQACFTVERMLVEMLDANVPLADIVAAAEAYWPQRQFAEVA